MAQDIGSKLRKLKPRDIVEITTKGGNSFFARFLYNEQGQFKFIDGCGILGYNLSGKSWGVDHSSELSAIADIRAIEQVIVLQFLNENKELFEKTEGK